MAVCLKTWKINKPMATKLDLQKEQNRAVSTSSPSLGQHAGAGVVQTEIINNPGELWRNAVAGREGLIQLESGLTVRAVSLDGDPVPVNLARKATTNFGLTIEPTSNARFYERYQSPGTQSITFRPSEFDSPNDRSELLISLVANLRGGSTRTITRTSSNTYTERYTEAAPTWGPAETPHYSVASETGRIIARYPNRQQSTAAIVAFNNLGRNTAFSTVAGEYTWDFHPDSTKARESYPSGQIVLGDTYEPDGTYAIRASGFAGANRDEARQVYPQWSGWQPARTVRKTGVPRGPLGPTRVGASNVSIRVDFLDRRGRQVATQTKNVANTGAKQTLAFSTNRTDVTQVRWTVNPGQYTAWLQELDFSLPRRFNNRAVKYYKVSQIDNQSGRETGAAGPIGNNLKFYAESAPIQVPNNAFITESSRVVPADDPLGDKILRQDTDNWNGTRFKKLSTRCPAWTLYSVLTDEKYGIQIAPEKIDAKSFGYASEYCNQVYPSVGRVPAPIRARLRWAYDGPLQGTQTEIVRTLLKLMRGWLGKDSQGRLSLSLERPGTGQFGPRWIICPAVVADGRLDYGHSVPKPAVRCSYTNRNTGQPAETPGLLNSRFEAVPWQDQFVAERWAKWQTYRDQNLLDTVSFTLPWDYYGIKVGDLVAVHDPNLSNVRSAGRILWVGFGSSYLEREEVIWVQLDRPPLEYWPQMVANAQLIEPLYSYRRAVDPALWGWVKIDFPFWPTPGPALRWQIRGGGIYDSPSGSVYNRINRIMWLPGGRPEDNRVELSIDFESRKLPSWAPERGDTWGIWNTLDRAETKHFPTYWRVESVSEDNTGRNFSVVATKHVPSMHDHIELGSKIRTLPQVWNPACGTKLSQFRGNWDDLNQRYPTPGTDPFRSGGTFDDLTTSCPR